MSVRPNNAGTQAASVSVAEELPTMTAVAISNLRIFENIYNQNFELLRSHTKLPEWLRIVAVEDAGQADKYLQVVDVGEAEAIELARELHADR